MLISDVVKKDVAARRHNIGSVSSGTMRVEDLVPTFLGVLRGQKRLKAVHRKLVEEIDQHREADDYCEGEEDDDLTVLDCEEDLDSLFDALEDYGPEGFYFGAHPGDGADYGWWLSENFIADFEGLKVNDLAEVPAGYTGEVLHVNDHGNPALYLIDGKESIECWGLV